MNDISNVMEYNCEYIILYRARAYIYNIWRFNFVTPGNVTSAPTVFRLGVFSRSDAVQLLLLGVAVNWFRL